MMEKLALLVGMPVLQLFLLCLLAPLFSWWVEEGAGFLAGRSVLPLGLVFRSQLGTLVGALKTGMSAASGLALAMIALVLLVLPGLAPLGLPDAATLTSILGDPLFLGLLLLGASAFLGVGVPALPEERASLGGAVLVLCITESLLIVAAPGVDGLQGVRVLLHEGPNPALTGTSACCALALAFTGAFPRARFLRVPMMENSTYFRQIFERRQSFLAFLQMGWLLLLGDVLLPGLSGETGGWALLACLGRLGAALAVVLVLQLTATERNARLAALLAGLGFLLALSGRFAA